MFYSRGSHRRTIFRTTPKTKKKKYEIGLSDVAVRGNVPRVAALIGKERFQHLF